MTMRTVVAHSILYAIVSMALLIGAAFKIGVIAPIWW